MPTLIIYTSIKITVIGKKLYACKLLKLITTNQHPNPYLKPFFFYFLEVINELS